MTFRYIPNAVPVRGFARLTMLATAILLPASAGLAEMATSGGAASQALRTAELSAVGTDSGQLDPFEGRIGCASIDLAGNRGIADDAGLGTALTLTKATIADGVTANKAI